MRRLRIVILIGSLHLKQVAIDGFVIFTVIVQPLLVAFLAIYLLQDTEQFSAFHVLVGSAMTGLWSGTLFFGANNIRVERWSGNLENIIASPTNLHDVVLGKTVANTAMSLSSILISYPLAALFFRFNLRLHDPLAFLISALVCLIAFVSLGQLIASAMSVVVGLNIWANALEFPMYIAAGFLFPISLLPQWVTPLSYLLSPYWVAKALQGSSSGALSWIELSISWVIAGALTIAYWIVAKFLFRTLIEGAIQKGTLGLQ